jgi:hypothetical protein
LANKGLRKTVTVEKEKYISYRAEGAEVLNHELWRRIQWKPADKHLVASGLGQGWFLAASGPSWADWKSGVVAS